MAANGVEVAAAYVTVLAKMPGIAKSINAAIGGVDTSAAGKKIGERIASDVGKSLKDQVAKKFADATAAALDKQTNSVKKLSDAEHALVKARAQAGTAHAKVSAAEAKLTKLRDSGKASAADLEVAEAALSKAQADATSVSRNVASAQNSVAEAKRNATEATKAYTSAVEAEGSKAERALAWMPLANQRIDEVSSKWVSAGSQISGVGDYFTNNITKPVTIATGAVGTLVSALGFKRLVGIDTARGQFQGLGMDADAVMKQVDAGVTNTSLSMAQGASMAVGILATGSVPLTDLEAQIKRVSNVSAAYGVEAEHANYLLNNVLTKNKVEWGDLSQMQQNQIPIVTQLADYYGVAGDEIMKMAQEGAISVTDLNTVLDQNAGAAAEAYASTWKGVTANVLSNLGRIGAKFLEPSFNIMKEEAASFLAFLKTDEFSTFATAMGDRIGEIVRQVSAGIKELIGWWNGLSDGQKGVILSAAGVFVALGPVLKIVGSLVTGIGKMIAVGKVVVALFTGWKVAAGGAALASGAFTGATTAQTVAMKAGATAQRVFNAVMNANPIVKIVTLVMGLVGALVYFFSSTETGKAIWAGFMTFLQEAWANISQFFQDVWNNVLKPVFEGIGQVLSFVWNSILKPVFDGIAAVATWVFQNILQPLFQAVQFQFAVMAGILQGIWDFILKPVFDAIGAIFKWLWDTIILVVITAIKTQLQILGAVFSWLWVNAIKPAVDAIGAAFNWLWANVISPVVGWVQEKWRILGLATQLMWTMYIQPALKAIGDALNWVWVNVISPVVDWIRKRWEILGLATRLMYSQYIKPAWDAVAGVIRTVWNKVKSVIDTMVRVIRSDPKKAFEAARDAIGTAWKGIQDLAKKPVRFVIETVINGLINTINKIPGVNLAKVPLPKGFSDGGYTGNIAPNAVAGVVHGNEHVIRAESRRAIESRHPGLLDHMNQYGSIPGYRKGGLVNPLPQGSYSVSQPYHGGHNGIDLAAPSGTKVFAAADGVVGLAGSVNMGGNEVYVQHANGLGTRYSHLSRFGTSAGQPVKAGNVIGYVGSTGMSTGPHLHYMVHNPGGGAGNYGNHVNPAPYLGIAGKDLGEAGGAQSILDGLVDWAVGKIKGAFPGGGMWIDVASALAKDAAGKMAKAFNPFAAADGHTTLYDKGGWLPTGKSLVENKTGRPEPILTGSQWDALLDGNSSGGARRVTVYIGDRPFEGWMDERADAAFDRGIEDELRSERFASYR